MPVYTNPASAGKRRDRGELRIGDGREACPFEVAVAVDGDGTWWKCWLFGKTRHTSFLQFSSTTAVYSRSTTALTGAKPGGDGIRCRSGGCDPLYCCVRRRVSLDVLLRCLFTGSRRCFLFFAVECRVRVSRSKHAHVSADGRSCASLRL